MKQVPLTQGYIAIVDDEDFEKIKHHKWSITSNKEKTHVYARAKIAGKTIKLHRYILGLTDKSMVVDHIDHNGLNNTRSNLRVCTLKENQANQKPKKNAASKYRGLAWNKQRLKWQVSIKVNGVQKYLGIYKNEDEAARVYDKHAKIQYGEFAYLNFKD